MTTALAVSAVLAAGALLASTAAAQRLAYPATSRGTVEDDFHGTKVADPYRWLEDQNAKATADWVSAQNAVTFSYLGTLPGRELIKKRLTELTNYARVSVPFIEGGRLFFRENSGLQKQSPLFAARSITDRARVVLDPNAISADGSTALAQVAPSPDGRYLAYALSEGGADWQRIVVRELATARDLADTVRWMRFSGISWTKDGGGFFYSRYPERPRGDVLSMALRDQKLYYHRVGTAQGADQLIFERPDLPTWFVGGRVTEDGRWLFVTMTEGTDPANLLFVADLGNPGRPNVRAPLTALVEQADADYTPLGTVGSTLYLRTDLNAPKRKIVAVDLRHPARNGWRTVIPEGASVIEGSDLIKSGFVISVLADVKSELRLYGHDGTLRSRVKLPGIGTVTGVNGRAGAADFFYGFTSPLYPTTIFHYAAATGRSTPFRSARPVFDPSKYLTRQVFYPSKDGTKVPMFITSRRDVRLDGTNPTMLYAYGGFNISTQPTFSTSVAMWLEQGGVYASANLRGGGEYGEAWHQAGKREKKQNVFDDFIAAAEYLIRERWTGPARLAIRGGSNGGLLVGAVMEQRPDLFGVALPAVGVMDMLRYDEFTGGKAWATEYGSSRDPAMFPVLLAYSPLHNVKPGTCYPATLVTTADHDDRVVPGHSFKFTAALQAAQGCDRPIVIRVETMGSHGYRPTDKQIAEQADLYAFTAANLKMPIASHSGVTP